MRVGASLLHCHADRVRGFLNHRFFKETEAGTVTRAARDAYFVYEFHFVQQAVVILGYILTKAPSVTARTHLVNILHGLVTDQFAMFDRILTQIGSPQMDMPDSVIRFCDGMTEIARDGSYGEGLAAIFAAEWTYAEASRRLSETVVEDPMLRDWFTLHTLPGFVNGVAWIENELETADGSDTSISAAFLRAVELEIEFHDAPFRHAGTLA